MYEVEIDGSYHESFDKADLHLQKILGTGRNNKCVMKKEERKTYIKQIKED